MFHVMKKWKKKKTFINIEPEEGKKKEEKEILDLIDVTLRKRIKD